MGFFSKLMGKEDSKQENVMNELDVMDAINAHIQWKLRLEKYLSGTSEEKLDPKTICLDNQCKLGKWIHGVAYEHFHEEEDFKTLRDDHALFHVIASDVVANVQGNEKEKAETLFKGEYMKISRKVVHDLTQLSKQMNP